MKTKFKSMFLLTVISIIGLLLTACQNDKTSSDSNGDVVELEVVSHKAELGEVWPKMLEAFHEEHPEIKVTVNNPPETATVLQTRAVANDMPDIATFPYNTAELGLVYEGYFIDLAEEGFLKEHYSPNVLEDNKIDGKNYYVPYLANATGFYYNIDLFEEHNLEVPNSTEELFNLLDALQSKNIMGLSFSDQETWTVGNYVDRSMGLFFNDQNELFQNIADGKESAVDHDGMRKVTELFLKLREYGQEDSLGIGYEQGVNEFANGNAAMMFGGTFSLALIKQSNPDLNVGMFPIPADNPADLKVGINMDYGLAISKDSKHIEEAKVFLDWLTKPENAQKFNDIEGSPSLVSGVNSEVKEFELINAAITEGNTYKIPRAYWKPGMVAEINKVFQDLVATKDVDGTLKKLDEAVKTLYNQ